MVRALVGSLFTAHRQGLAPEGLHDILARRNRGAAGEAAPPGGLYLAHVAYPGEPEPDMEQLHRRVCTLAGFGIPKTPERR